MKKFMFDIQRFKSINNREENTLVSGSASDDKIKNSVANVTIAAGGGNDSIVNNDYADNVSISGGDGNDTISNKGKNSSNSTINGDAGNDSILNNSNDVTIDGGGGNDTVSNSGDNVSIDAGDGKDSIVNSGAEVKIIGGAGNDIIFNKGENSSNSTINGGAGNDSINNNGSYVIIDAGDGKDSVDNSGSNVTIVGGNDNDTINNSGDNASIDGGDGNDKINNNASNATINSGAGDDNISLKSGSNNNLIIYSGGNDLIRGFNETDTLQIGDGSKAYTSTTSGKDIILKVGEDLITLQGAATLGTLNISGYLLNPLRIPLSEKADTYSNNREAAIIEALGGNDSIYNNSGYSSVSGGAGNDTIYNNSGKYVSIDGGLGNDSVNNNYGDDSTIDTGAGNDTIYDKSGDSIIKGGAGNDSVFHETGYTATIDGGSGNDTVNINAYAYNISVNGGDGNDLIVLNSSGSSGFTIKGGAGNDTINNSNGFLCQYTDGDGNDLITGFNASSTLQIGNGDATDTYSSAVSGDDVIVTVGKGKITLQGAASLSKVKIDGMFTYKGHSYRLYPNSGLNWEEAKAYCEELGGHLVTITDSGEQEAIQNLIKNGSNSSYFTGGYRNDSDIWQWVTGETFSYTNWKSGEPNNSGGVEKFLEIYQSGGEWNDVKFEGGGGFICEWDNGNSNSNSKSIKLTEGNDTYKNTVGGASIQALGGNDTITNSGKKVTISGGKGNDIIKNSGANVLFNYASGDGNDIITGFNSTSTLKIGNGKGTYSAKTSGKNIIVTVGSGKITLSGAASLSKLNIAGTKKATVASTLLTVNDKTTSPVTVGSSIKNINASARTTAVKITGNASANSIIGGKGDDTLGGGKGNDTLTGGKGKDVFVYTAGNDVITDYAAEDKISIASGKVSTVKTSGSDLIFTADNGKITVKSGANKTVTYFDSDGKHAYKKSSDNAKLVTLDEDYDKETYTMGDKLRTVDASAVELDIKITGNKFANRIIGGDQNDTLIGGKANDTLVGNGGADIFLYNKGDGNDKILDYAAEDKISIAGDKVSNIKSKGSDIIFTVGSGTITVVGGKDKLITYIDSKGEHIYPQIFTVKGKTITLTDEYTKKDFDVADYGDYKNINASSVEHGLNIVGNDSSNNITGTSDEDIIDGGANNDTIRGGNGNDSIFGGKGKDYLYGGEGNDTLWGGKGNDYLYGGDGADIFIFDKSDGTDKIFDYEQGVDKIMILSNKKPTLDGTPLSNDITFNVGSGKIVVANGANKSIEFIKSNGKSLYTYVPSSAS